MKISLSLVSLLATGASAFAPMTRPTVTTTALHVTALPIRVNDAELEAAIADVRKAASEFSPETVHFANVWIDRILQGKLDGVAAGLLEECVLDDNEKCQRYSKALTHLDNLLGVGATEQY